MTPRDVEALRALERYSLMPAMAHTVAFMLLSRHGEWLRRDDVLALLPSADAPAAGGQGTWQPIATAPADRIVFLAKDTGDPFGWTLGTGHLTAFGWVTRGIGEVVADGLGLAHPTHWMPLPDPPAVPAPEEIR